MIKINLLPPGIYEKKIVRNLAILFAVLAMLIAGGGVGYRLKLNADIAKKTIEVEDVEAKQRITRDLRSKAEQELAKIAPAQAKVDFIENVFAHNEKWPKLYEELAKYTYEKVLYRKLTPSADSLQIEAFTPSISDAGRFLLNMYRATDIFSAVSISGLPGYPRERDAGAPMQAGWSELHTGPGMTPLPTGVSPHVHRYRGMEAVSVGVERAAVAERAGLTFTVTCRLREPINPPELPGVAVPDETVGPEGMMMPGPAMTLPDQDPSMPTMTMPQD